MKTKFVLIAFIIMCSTAVKSQTIDKPEQVWSDVIELEQSILQRHVVYDIPGMIAVLVPKNNGSFKPYLIGKKVLKDLDKLPELISKPTVLYSDVIQKSFASKLSYLSFASASMSDNEELRFSITETSYTNILDNDIDWDLFDERVAEIKKKNSNLPQGTKFGVVKIASIIMIDNQKFKNVKGAGKISGWGFSGDAKHLSESSKKRVDFKVGISLTYSDLHLKDLITKLPETENKSIELLSTSNLNKIDEPYMKQILLKGFNELIKDKISEPAIDLGNDLQIKLE